MRERVEIGPPGEFERLSRMTDEELDAEQARIVNEIIDDHKKRGAVLSIVPKLPAPKVGDGKPLGLLSDRSNPVADGNGAPDHDRPWPGLNPDNGATQPISLPSPSRFPAGFVGTCKHVGLQQVSDICAVHEGEERALSAVLS